MGAEVIARMKFEQFRQLPNDGKRYELIHGEVHETPSPTTRHQAVLQNLSGNLWIFVIKNRLGEVWTAPLDVRLSEETALQPDLIFISNANAAIIQEDWIAGSPDLVVEVLSPSTAVHDRGTKLRIYGNASVPEVWFIDPWTKIVEIFGLQGKKYFVEASLAGDEVIVSSLFPGWQLPLQDLFDFRGRF